MNDNISCYIATRNKHSASIRAIQLFVEHLNVTHPMNDGFTIFHSFQLVFGLIILCMMKDV